MNQRWFVNKFLDIAGEKTPESCFISDFTLTYSINDDYDGPTRYVGDVIEIDGMGRLHLWLFRPLHSPELASGDVIGRLFAFTMAFRMTPADEMRHRIERAAGRARRPPAPHLLRRLLRKSALEFASWNLVVCGGQGCELAARADNLPWHLYTSLSRDVEHIRDVNTWHFYRTDTGLDLRSLWDFAGTERLTMADRLAVLGDRSRLEVAPDDDFDIACKHDLHLKRKKGFHRQALDAYFTDRTQVLAG